MKTILVPSDFSANSVNALKYANAFAKAVKCGLTLLNVYTPSGGKYSMISGLIAEEIAEARFKGGKQLKKLADKYVSQKCKSIVEVGDTSDEIIEVAKREKSDLIIMGTHGESGLKGMVFGSNTAGVIAESKTPVLAIPQKYAYKKIKTIVYASDLQNPVEELNLIIPIAKKLNAKIEIFTLDYGTFKMGGKEEVFINKIKSRKIKNISVVEKRANIAKSMSEQIQAHVRKTKPGLLVMFPEKKTLLEKILGGSSTKQLTNHLKLPLLSIKKPLGKSKKTNLI